MSRPGSGAGKVAAGNGSGGGGGGGGGPAASPQQQQAKQSTQQRQAGGTTSPASTATAAPRTGYSAAAAAGAARQSSAVNTSAASQGVSQNSGTPAPPRSTPQVAAAGAVAAAVASSSSNSTPTAASANGFNPNLLKYLRSYASQPVRVTLDDGSIQIGLLWAFDVAMGVLVLEVPKATSMALGLSSPGYPSNAAAFPTALSSTAKVAAQGGDVAGTRTTFQIYKLRRVQRVDRLQQQQQGQGQAQPQSQSQAAGNAQRIPNDAAIASLHAAKPTPIMQDINVTAAEARERAATAEAMKRAQKIGVGVSRQAQQVFDALNKTLPCRWADQHIIVMDEFAISPDKYDTVTAPNVKQSTLQALADGKDVPGTPIDAKAQAMRWQRVAKVLDGERRKFTTVSGQ